MTLLKGSHGGRRPGSGAKKRVYTCQNPKCGQQFKKAPRGSRRYGSVKFCSKSCTRAARSKATDEPVEIKVCRCGAAFVLDPKRRRRTCSDACRASAQAAAARSKTIYQPRACEQCGRTFRRTPKHSKRSKDTLRFCCGSCSHEWHRHSGMPRRGTHSSILVLPCAECGQLFTRHGQHHRLTCSAECRRSLFARAHPPKPKPIHLKAVHSGVCACCDAVFTWHGPKRRRFCSARCARKVGRREMRRKHGNNSRRSESRARHKGVPVVYGITWLKVCARDGWRCQLCGCATPRRLRGTYLDNAPEVDHILPFDAGGAHTWDNVQCACRKCNGEKAGKPLGQLRLAM